MVFLVFTAWLILSQVMISLVQAFFAPAGYGFLAGITYAAQAGAHVVFIWIFRSHLPHAAGKKEAGLRNGLQMVLFSAMTGIGLCMAHRVLFFLFPHSSTSLADSIGFFWVPFFSLIQIANIFPTTLSPNLTHFLIFCNFT